MNWPKRFIKWKSWEEQIWFVHWEAKNRGQCTLRSLLLRILYLLQHKHNPKCISKNLRVFSFQIFKRKQKHNDNLHFGYVCIVTSDMHAKHFSLIIADTKPMCKWKSRQTMFLFSFKEKTPTTKYNMAKIAICRHFEVLNTYSTCKICNFRKKKYDKASAKIVLSAKLTFWLDPFNNTLGNKMVRRLQDTLPSLIFGKRCKWLGSNIVAVHECVHACMCCVCVSAYKTGLKPMR